MGTDGRESLAGWFEVLLHQLAADRRELHAHEKCPLPAVRGGFENGEGGRGSGCVGEGRPGWYTAATVHTGPRAARMTSRDWLCLGLAVANAALLLFTFHDSSWGPADEGNYGHVAERILDGEV